MVDVKARLSRNVKLRRVGGSDMLTIPRAMLNALDLEANADVRVELTEGRLVVTPAAPQRPHFTLDELIAQCDAEALPPDEDRAWTTDGPKGKELI